MVATAPINLGTTPLLLSPLISRTKCKSRYQFANPNSVG